MAITVRCAGCGKSFRVKDGDAGRRGKCPFCQGVVEVPAVESGAKAANAGPGLKPEAPQASVARVPTPAVNAPRPQAAHQPPGDKGGSANVDPARGVVPAAAALEQQILGAFQGEIARVRVSIVYRFAIVLVAVLMVLLPLIYVGLIGAVGYLMYLHAVNDVGLLGVRAGRAWLLVAVVYFGPLAAGAILLMFMVKPFFAPPARQSRTRSLTRKSDPLLFAFVDRVCAVVRAPRPKRIDVDCEVNASAGFRRGLWSMFGNDLVLTIGLPLAGGLTLRQFAGVLAHEFGHFTQGTGMRVTYLIRRVNWWLTRVVYERDGWDEWLVESCQDADWRFVLVLQLARLLVWLTHKVLWVLMMLGHAVGGFMLRQMEFDADRHEARLAGSDVFESTVRRLMLLNAAHQGAQADLWRFSHEGRLPDNLPRLILANVDQIPADARARLGQVIDRSRTRLFDTHPCDKDRIARARRENAPGVFHLDLPARVLFSDFPGLGRNVTWDVYCGIFGSRFQPSAMHPIDDLLAREDKEIEAGRALVRYFQGAFSSLRPLPLAGRPSEAAVDPRSCAARLRTERQRMLDLKPAYSEVLAAYEKDDLESIEADQAVALSKADVKVRRGDFSTDLTSAVAATHARRKAGERKERAAARLADFEQAAAARLSSALELLQAPQVAARIENAAEQQKESAQLFSAVRALAVELPWILTLRNECAALGMLLNKIEGNQRNEQFIWTVQRAADAVAVSVRERRNQLNLIRYPLDHAKGTTTVGEYMVPAPPSPDDVVGIYQAGQAAVDSVLVLYARLVARLALVAEQIEKALGLEPLPEPPEKDKPSESA